MGTMNFKILKIDHVLDGDTAAFFVDLRFKGHERQLMPLLGTQIYDLGFRMYGTRFLTPHELMSKQVVRICNIDTPEIHSEDKLEAEAALVAQSFAVVWFSRALQTGKAFVVSHGLDNYGRALGDVQADGLGFYSEEILKAGLARPYHGEAKKEWPVADLQRIAAWKAPV